MAAEMTVVEFASKHCAEQGKLTTEQVQEHVNSIILTAMSMNRALWTVVVDEDGRASLIFISLPRFVWDQLLADSIKTRALIAVLGGLGL